ncbi:MAG TPA: hypothetical protein VG452_12105 [Egibacteraceae bacterium]|nr:hypothetical protein [Actinomycetota bacterium]HWB72949.1 hypothetical protein [Egibacteraceae bacterium]
MDQLHVPKSESLRALYWRSEILQVMYWLHGEGLGEEADATLLQRFLGVDAAIGVTYLDRLVEEGYLERAGDRYRLSARGLEEGREEFAASFADLTRPSHGECSADCWCHASVEEAEACAAERAAHKHSHP